MSELRLQQCRLDGRYDTLDCLGRGSYSEVYLAYDTAAAGSAPHEVVIKALNPYLQGAPDAELERTLVENFRNEAIALDRVRHPNIISRLGHGTAIDLSGRTFHYLVLEYLPGGDMAGICRHHPLALEHALFYLEQVCAGLSYAHEREVIHRDIKPQNLLLTADRRTIKIADFGVAKIHAVEGAITRVGTDVYAAPEHHPLAQTGPLDTDSVVYPVKHLTPAADIYSLAKTTYMMLTGEAPRRFSLKPITELPPRFVAEPWGPFVLRVLRRATATNQAERYQTVREYWDELRDAALPQTQLLTPNGNERAPSFSQRNNASASATKISPVPLPPTFTSPPPPSQENGRHLHHPRIVVPISVAAPERHAEEMWMPQPQTAPVVSGQNAPDGSPEVVSGGYISSFFKALIVNERVRRWLVAVLLIAAFTGMLLATHKFFSNRPLWGAATGTSNAATTAAAVGHEYVTPTDINLRQGPGINYARIGLAEEASRVRVLKVSNNWCQVEVIKHGRDKEDPNSSDQGWLNSDYLK